MDTVAAMTTDKAGFEEIEKTAAAIYAEIAEFEARLRLYEQENVRQQCENSRLNEMLDEIAGGQASLEQYDDVAVRRLIIWLVSLPSPNPLSPKAYTKSIASL